jgi:hypothetical protein
MIQPFNVCQGPATVYWSLFGATEPAGSAITAPPNPAIWTDVGGIADGTSVLLEIDLTYTDQGVAQLVDPIGARLTKRVIQLTAALEEATLQNINLAQNQLTTISPQSGFTQLSPVTASSATQPTYTALIIDGWAPTTGLVEPSARRRIILRKALSSSKVDLEYEKTKPNVLNTTWTGYWVSGTVPPYDIYDQTA